MVDLLVFADGYRSLGRSLMFPDTDLSYRRYVLWRGVFPEAHLDDPEPMRDTLVRTTYRGLAGMAVFYLVPGRDGQTEEGQRLVNWACYIPLDPADLSQHLTDREDVVRTGSVPPGKLRPEEERRLKDLMRSTSPRTTERSSMGAATRSRWRSTRSSPPPIARDGCA